LKAFDLAEPTEAADLHLMIGAPEAFDTPRE
jgi:hypothetical protein